MFKKDVWTDMVLSETPRCNERILKGWATPMSNGVAEFIDKEVWGSAKESLPPGLEYVKCEKCSPKEAYQVLTAAKSSKRTYDIARSDLVLYKFWFKYDGELLRPRYQFLPFWTEFIYLSGTPYHISPVLADNVFSPGNNTVFVKLLRVKLNFERSYHTYICNNEIVSGHVVHGVLYRNGDNKKKEKTTKAQTTTAHYLYAKYGFSETWMRYFGFVPEVFEYDVEKSDKYREQGYTVFRSTSVKPRTYIGNFYKGNNLCLAIKKELVNPSVLTMVCSFFYIVDHFPTRVNKEDLNDTVLWMVTLGEIIHTGHYYVGKLYESMVVHLKSIINNSDTLIIKKLKDSGYHKNYILENFFDILFIIQCETQKWLTEGSHNQNLFNKRFEVYEYLLLDIVRSIFNTIFELDKKSQRRKLVVKEIDEVFNRNLGVRAIFNLVKVGGLNTIASSTDAMIFKISSIFEVQSPTSGGKSKKRQPVTEELRIHSSHAAIGNILGISKDNPTAVKRLNPYLQIDDVTGCPIPDPEYMAGLERIDELLKTNEQVGFDTSR